MPETLSDWILSLLPVTAITVSAVYAACHHARGRLHRRLGVPPADVYPGSREHAGDLNYGWWRSLSTEEQAAYDAEVIEATAVAEEHAREAAEALLERRAQINATFHP